MTKEIRMLKEPKTYEQAQLLFGPTIPREGIQKLLNEGERFALFQTAINPATQEEMIHWEEQYLGNKTNAVRTDKPHFAGGTPDPGEPRGLSLSPRHIELYNSVLAEEAIKRFGPYAAFNTWNIFASHGINVPQQTVDWPKTHLVREEHAIAFKDLVTRLHEEGYEAAKRRDAPQNYLSGTIDKLKELGLPPLKVTGESRMTAEVIATAVNFFSTHSLHFVSRSYGY